MKRRRSAAFTLVKFVVAIVFVGVVMGPLLVYVARIHDLNNAVGQQARIEAWRSFNDQAVAAGINPALAPALASTANLAVPNLPPIAVEQETTPPVAGLPTIVPIRVAAGAAIPEPRLLSAGFQIGAGGTLPPRGVPAAPLSPIVMPMPLIAPADGSLIAAASLTPASLGQPYTLTVTATSSPGSSVHLVFNQPHASAEGSGSAQQSVSAIDLLNAVNGTAWTEFPGSVTHGDRAVVLGDGRTRWLVTTTEHRLQIYEPSGVARFAYHLGLGAPVVAYAGQEYSAGSAVGFDYAAFLAVQNGTVRAMLDFPAAIKAAFGNAWSAQTTGYQWTFHDVAGPFSGDAAPFFLPDALTLWADDVILRATAVVPAGAVADPAQWSFRRIKTPLGVPILASAADGAGFHSPGHLQFSAPATSDGTTVGRLSFENGANVSTGPTLSIAVIP